MEIGLNGREVAVEVVRPLGVNVPTLHAVDTAVRLLSQNLGLLLDVLFFCLLLVLVFLQSHAALVQGVNHYYLLNITNPINYLNLNWN